MSDFIPVVYDLSLAEVELSTFKTWFASKGFIGETEIVGEIKKRPQMACLLGSLFNMPAPDLIKFELTMKCQRRSDFKPARRSKSGPLWARRGCLQ